MKGQLFFPCLVLLAAPFPGGLAFTPVPPRTKFRSRLHSSETATKEDSSRPLPQETTHDPNVLPMGISQELYELPKGKSLHRQIPCCSSNASQDKVRDISVTKLSHQPPIFHLKGLLSVDECQAIIDHARAQHMEDAQTHIGDDDNQYRQKSKMVWIPDDTPPDNKNNWPDFQSLATSVHAMLLPMEPQPLVPEALEALQVVKYDTGGQYRLHHDGARRLLTVLYYLNGVSDTWFPLADDDAQAKHFLGTPREQALQVAQQRDTSEGVRVQNVEAGDAIAFYNYFQNATPDWQALHAGLPAASDKWIATHWYHHVPPRAVADHVQTSRRR